jgi:putative aldouronate transport system permease protein
MSSHKPTSALKISQPLDKKTFLQSVVKYRERYLLLLPAVAAFLIFRYVPMAGIVLAWKRYTIQGGIFGSPWAGWTYFLRLFEAPEFLRVVKNTLFINGVLRMVIGFPMPILFALLLNEIRKLGFKKGVQTISYLPHFLSWVIVAGLVRALTATQGPINLLRETFGGADPVLFLQEDAWFLVIIVVSDIWKGIGWGSIIYLAAITSIDPLLYESADMDGATRIQKMVHITIPSIMYVIVLMFLLRIGNILELGFDQIFNLYNPLVYDVADVIGTYAYRTGILQGQFSYATAVGLFQNLIGLLALVAANTVAKRLGVGEYSVV